MDEEELIKFWKHKRIARGAVHRVHVHPQGGDKKLEAKFTGESCKCTSGRECTPLTPEAEQEFNFLGNWGDLDGGRGYLGSFSVCFVGDD